MSAQTPPNEPVLPRHVDPQWNDTNPRLSYAPYNFVPLPDAVMPAPRLDDGPAPWERHDAYVSGLHSGWIDLRIHAETPLYVRCAPPVEHADNEEPRTNRHRQEFFHHGDPQRPVLPGSSLRGMIRSLVEVLAHAKLTCGLFSDRRLIYRAVGDTTSLGVGYRNDVLGPNRDSRPRHMSFDYPAPELRGGYLRRRGSDWYIQPAREIRGETFVHVEYQHARPIIGGQGRQRTHQVFVAPVARTNSVRPPRNWGTLSLNLALTTHVSRNREPGLEPAWLVESGHMGGQNPKHWHCAIYEPDPDAQQVAIDRDLWDAYEEDRDLTRGIPTRPLRNDGDPLFYLVDDQGQLVFFGPTMMFRLPYPHWIAEFVPERLRRDDTIDLAEAIFGRVQPSAIKGRVFVEDAVWDGQGGSPFYPDDQGRRTPHILGTPKPTAFQHYLVQPQDQQGASSRPLGADRQTLCNYHHPFGGGPYTFTNNQGGTIAQTDGTVLRGYKRYWHRPHARSQDRFRGQVVQAGDQAESQLTIIRPVKEGTGFCGRLRFENLTDVELGALLTALQLPPSKRHHVGMGKPLGLGSVRIEAALRLTERERRYATLFGSDGRVDLGETDGGTVAEQCRAAFAGAVVAHHNATSSPQVAGGADGLWSIPRLRALSALLEWAGAPAPERVGYAPPDAPPGDLRWWRNRQVLPTAEFVAGVQAAPASHQASAAPLAAPPAAAARKPTSYKSGDRVEPVLLSERTRKLGWKATIAGTGLTGPVQGTPPADAVAGQSVQLVVASFTAPQTVSFWWPDSAPGTRRG
jgi:CRISPR-associated protein (TIGR03986 family)